MDDRWSDRSWPLLRLALLVAMLGSFSGSALAQFGPPPPPRPSATEPDPADAVAVAARDIHAQNLARHGNDPEMLVRPGLLADRKAGIVRIWGKATSLSMADPVEFFLIPPDSGKDYEALAVGFVRPSDVHAALEFIGVKPGRPVRFDENRFWPKGERITMHFEWEEPPAKENPAGKPASRRIRAEELIIDTRTGSSLTKEGLVFTGSFWITPEEGDGKLYAADVVDPRSIASNYNDRGTVLDVPRQAPQGQVYGFQKLNPAYRFAPGQAVQIVLEPEHKDGKTRVRDLSLQIGYPDGADVKAPAGIHGLQFVLSDADGQPVAGKTTFIHALAEFGRLHESGQDPYVTLHFDERMPLRIVREACRALASLDNEKGIRIEAPAPGHLYYRAFLPDERWRDREQRLGRPWELHLSLEDANVSGRLELPADEIDRRSGREDQVYPIASADELAQTLEQEGDRWSQTVLVFAPPSMTYGQLISFIRPGMKTHPTMYIFLAQ